MLLLNPNLLRVYEAETPIDPGEVITALPAEVVQHLGLKIRSQQIAKYVEGRQETVKITEPDIIEMFGRETTEAAMVLGDTILIDKTVL